jgi:ribosome-associated toxin RatA of RatAB toxin-antitoxin module
MPRSSALRLLASALLPFALLVGAGTAHADDEATKLSTRAKALRYVVPRADAKTKTDLGGAAIFVSAPIDVVRGVVTDYSRYSKFVKAFKQSRLLSKKDGESDVYLDVPVAHGAANVWAVVRWGKPVASGGEETITGRFVKGNLDEFRAVWRLRKVDETHTVLKLELLVDPELPLPMSLITPELAYAADRAVTGVRDESHARAGYAADAPSSVAGGDEKPSNVAKR